MKLKKYLVVLTSVQVNCMELGFQQMGLNRKVLRRNKTIFRTNDSGIIFAIIYFSFC